MTFVGEPLPPRIKLAQRIITIALVLSVCMVALPLLIGSLFVFVVIGILIFILMAVYLPMFCVAQELNSGGFEDTFGYSCCWITFGLLHFVPAFAVLAITIVGLKNGKTVTSDLLLGLSLTSVPSILGVMMIVGAWIAMANRQAYRLWRQRRQTAMEALVRNTQGQ
jgi:hypothetical protein